MTVLLLMSMTVLMKTILTRTCMMKMRTSTTKKRKSISQCMSLRMMIRKTE